MCSYVCVFTCVHPAISCYFMQIYTDSMVFIMVLYVSGWWFQTFFIFHNIWDNPSHWLIFFKMVKTTNQVFIWFSYEFTHVITASPHSWPVPTATARPQELVRSDWPRHLLYTHMCPWTPWTWTKTWTNIDRQIWQLPSGKHTKNIKNYGKSQL